MELADNDGGSPVRFIVIVMCIYTGTYQLFPTVTRTCRRVFAQ
eukprot:SAG11_NODE_16447_length_547_cov_0.803571_1_plen_42_part_01